MRLCQRRIQGQRQVEIDCFWFSSQIVIIVCYVSYEIFGNSPSLMSAAIEMASEIAEKSPVAVQGTKVNLNYARDHSVQDALEFVVRAE